MYELYGQHLITGNEFTVKISNNRRELQHIMYLLLGQTNVAYRIVKH